MCDLGDLRNTLKLLYRIDRSAFVVGTVASVLEAVVHPVVLLVVWRGIGLVVAGASAEGLTWTITAFIPFFLCKSSWRINSAF